jgi:hypothetical protein
MNVDEQGGFDEQGTVQKLWLGDADGEHKLRRGSTDDEVDCDGVDELR